MSRTLKKIWAFQWLAYWVQNTQWFGKVPLISSLTALTFLQDLTHYFLSLPVSSLLPVPRSSSINVSKPLSNTHRSLNQYLATQKKQSSLDHWLPRFRRQGV